MLEYQSPRLAVRTARTLVFIVPLALLCVGASSTALDKSVPAGSKMFFIGIAVTAVIGVGVAIYSLFNYQVIGITGEGVTVSRRRLGVRRSMSMSIARNDIESINIGTRYETLTATHDVEIVTRSGRRLCVMRDSGDRVRGAAASMNRVLKLRDAEVVK